MVGRRSCSRGSRLQRWARATGPPLFAPPGLEPSGFPTASSFHPPSGYTPDEPDSGDRFSLATRFRASQAIAHDALLPPRDLPPLSRQLRALPRWRSPARAQPQGLPFGTRPHTGSMLSISASPWLAGIASSAISELPLPFPAPWVLLSLAGHHPVLSPLRTHLHYCPALMLRAPALRAPFGAAWRQSVSPVPTGSARSTPFSGASSLLCRTPTPALAASAFPVSRVVPGVADCSARGQASRVTPSALSNIPSPLTPPDRCADSNGCLVRTCQPSSFRKRLGFPVLVNCSAVEISAETPILSGP